MPPNIPTLNGDPYITLLAPAESLALGALYSIGINQAVARLKSSSNNSGENYTLPDNDYSPDAQPTSDGYKATDRWDGRLASSLIGMPVMCYIKFVGGTYKTSQGKEVTIPDVTFETCLINLTFGKLIKKEDINGRETGSVKEFITQKDWIVELQVIVTADAPVNDNVNRRNQEGVYPRDNMSEIWEVLRAPISIPVECWYLQQFDIHYLMIEDGVQINQISGEYTAQRLTIPCVSDNPLIIKILK